MSGKRGQGGDGGGGGSGATIRANVPAPGLPVIRIELRRCPLYIMYKGFNN